MEKYTPFENLKAAIEHAGGLSNNDSGKPEQKGKSKQVTDQRISKKHKKLRQKTLSKRAKQKLDETSTLQAHDQTQTKQTAFLLYTEVYILLV